MWINVNETDAYKARYERSVVMLAGTGLAFQRILGITLSLNRFNEFLCQQFLLKLVDL